MKTISILIPCYNEKENLESLVSRVKEIFFTDLKNFRYEIVIIDNCSTDGSKDIIARLCLSDSNIKAIFNQRNFGPIRSVSYGIMQTTGDCTIQMAADFQDVPELICNMVKKWEEGYKIVITQKTKSDENRWMYFLRSCYYKLIKRIADIKHIEHFTGFGLYDKSFVQVLRDLKDPQPYLRGIVAELGGEYASVEYVQPKRQKGKSKTNWYSLYDFGMVGITSYSKVVMRLATIFGFISSGLSLLVALGYLIAKLLFWSSFPVGIAPLLIGVFFFNSLQLFFIGLLGEYILSMNTRIMNRPLVIEEERINF